MDLESQGRIKQVVEQVGTDGVVAVLGANSAAAVEMTATTLMSGDPSWAGPLAGIALNIPSFHVLEESVTSALPQPVYDRELALSALATDVDEVTAPLRALREGQ
jgi:glycine/sarcosine/betaine reductase complex component A